MTSGLAYYAVEQQLTQKSLDQLRGESKDYALSVLEKLQFSWLFLMQLETRKSEEKISFDDTFFTQIEVISPVSVEQGSPAALQAVKYPGEAFLEVRAHEESPSVWMTIVLSPTEAISGQVNPLFLWGSPDLFPSSVTFCVLDNDGMEIFCPDPPQDHALGLWREALQTSSVGTLHWTEDDVAYLAGYFGLPLRFEFSVLQWSVVAIQTKAHALAPMSGFRAVFPPAIGLSVILALWISFHQVRRRLGPLKMLTDAAATIAGGDFTAEIGLESRDEFQFLAHSFNKMRRDLGRQFGTLRALSDLDQKILAAKEVQPVVEGTVRRMLDLFDCQCAAITVVEKDAENIAQVIWCGASKEIHVDRVHLSTEHRLAQCGPFKGPLAEADAAYLKPLKATGATVFQTLPVVRKNQLIGIITLGYQDTESLDSSATTSLPDFGDRLAVALQTINRAEQLYHRAHYDSLTKLPNRQLFKDRLEQSIAQAIAHGHTNALLFIDLDHFKTVNDSEGHTVGDKLLRLAGQRLRRCIDSADTVARLGGDEFTVILSDLKSPRDAAHASKRIIDALSEPFQIGTMEHFLGASIGITMIPADGSSVEELLRNADIAMYKAKDLGRRRSVFFEERMNRDAEEHVLLAADLRHSLERNELVLYYQPKVDLVTYTVVGAEALIRWMHPARGLVRPDRFIPIAEETGLIVDIGQWVIRQATKQLSAWQRQGVLEELSVNVSYRQIRDSNLVETVKRALHDNALEPATLEIEFTESMMAEDKQVAMTTLSALRNIGVRVAIDDFGTGYSSFSYLRELSFDTLKIDKAFIDDVPGAPTATAIMAGIIQIGTLLGKNIVAEGVTTENQAKALLKYGCGMAQGYFFSRPLPASDFEVFVSQRATRKLA
ncbi:MAG: EAL domain-containing protein [Gammaproteobacteria bacterium]|nr:EAL domain-containing protein [Gammaproteobacteria bacterium]